jgi:hypothetical protein
MKCDRLIYLVKNWYLQVQEEAMAPARMVAFMEKHISQCAECLDDPDVKQEAKKIREIVLPPSKVPKPKVVRVPKEVTSEEEDAEKENITGVEDAEKDGTAEDIDRDEEDTADEEDEDEDDDLEPDQINDDLI